MDFSSTQLIAYKVELVVVYKGECFIMKFIYKLFFIFSLLFTLFGFFGILVSFSSMPSYLILWIVWALIGCILLYLIRSKMKKLEIDSKRWHRSIDTYSAENNSSKSVFSKQGGAAPTPVVPKLRSPKNCNPVSISPPNKVLHSSNEPLPRNAPTSTTFVSKSSGAKIETYNVAGTSYHSAAIKELGYENTDYCMTKKELIDSCIEDERIYQYEFSVSNCELIEEPDNIHDPNAIMVMIDSSHVGYIKKGNCSHIKKLIRTNSIKKISAEISGGKYKILYCDYDDERDKDIYTLDRDEVNFSVKLKLTFD